MSDPKDPLEAAKLFNDAVRSTAVIGELVTTTKDTNDRVARIEPKIDKVVSTMDRYGGMMVLVGGLISIAVSLVVAFIPTLFR